MHHQESTLLWRKLDDSLSGKSTRPTVAINTYPMIDVPGLAEVIIDLIV